MSIKIVELQNRITELKGQIAGITNGGEVSPEDAVRLGELHGRLDEAMDNLSAAAVELQAENARIAAEATASPEDAIRDAAGLIFGPQDSFEGIEPGWKTSVPTAKLFAATQAARMMAAPRDAVSGLPTPTYVDYSLPAPIAPIMGFLNTLPQGLTDGHETYFQTPTLVNAANGWTTGDKPESSISWSQATAHIETIAHQMPVAKQTVRRYRQLENTIVGALLLGLDIRKNQYALKGTNSSGIVGAHNIPGTLSYTKASDDENIRDIAIEMALRVRLATGFSPNYVCVSPQALAKAKKAKDKMGRYMYPEIVYDGKIEGMEIVEDVEMHVVTTVGEGANAVTTETDAMAVYFNGALSWNTADPDAIDIGLIDKQFIQNTYTILAEGTHALKVPFPAAVCFCDDIGGASGDEGESE